MENQNIIETRFINEIRADAQTGIISLTPIVFNSESELLGGAFREKIMPQAVTEEFLKSQDDIKMLFNHDQNNLLARYRKNGQRNSLSFNVDDRGANASFKIKAKDSGLLESISSGDIGGASFAFRVSDEPNSETWEKRSDNSILRTIYKMQKVADFSIVTDPAYSQTQVSTRGLDEIKQKEELEKAKIEADKLKAEQDKAKEEAEKLKIKSETDKKIIEYYRSYEDKINALKK